jgi:CheY-like chemotaxis protein
MDIMMPEIDGLEATETIRKNPLFKTLPILALTAKAMKGDQEKCLEAGASDYITKPVDPERLLATIHLWLNKQPSLVGVAE